MSLKSRIARLERELRGEDGCDLCWPKQIEFIDIEPDQQLLPADLSVRICPGCGRRFRPEISFIAIVKQEASNNG